MDKEETTPGGRAKKKIDRAGFVPYFVGDDSVEMFFMKPSDPKFGGPLFQIAKGKVDPGETVKEAAIREAQEELGMFPANIQDIENLGKFLGRTTFFIGRVIDKEMFGDPHFETGAVKWMTLEEFMSQGRGLHKPVISAAMRRIKTRLK